MAYTRSSALLHWSGSRADVIATLRRAHGAVGRVTGRGRPLAAGQPVVHAYVMVMVAEFQGFVRDLHDLAIDHLVRAAVTTQFANQITAGLREGRSIDRNNATSATFQADFRRVGILDLNNKLGLLEPRWRTGDSRSYQTLLELRNCLAHGNQTQLARLRAAGVKTTVTWADRHLRVLNRAAAALDAVVWDDLTATTRGEPW